MVTSQVATEERGAGAATDANRGSDKRFEPSSSPKVRIGMSLNAGHGQESHKEGERARLYPAPVSRYSNGRGGGPDSAPDVEQSLARFVCFVHRLSVLRFTFFREVDREPSIDCSISRLFRLDKSTPRGCTECFAWYHLLLVIHRLQGNRPFWYSKSFEFPTTASFFVNRYSTN